MTAIPEIQTTVAYKTDRARQMGIAHDIRQARQLGTEVAPMLAEAGLDLTAAQVVDAVLSGAALGPHEAAAVRQVLSGLGRERACYEIRQGMMVGGAL